MERAEQRRIVEGLVLAAAEPVPAARLAAIVPGADAARVRELVTELNAAYEREGRAFAIEEVAGGYQLRTRLDLACYVQELKPERPLRLSRAALETLAIVAYKQPLTRAEVEHVRGVDAGPVLRSLLERQLLRIAGHREVPGRPLLYGTTRRFLEVFGLRSLRDLPALRQLAALAPQGEAPPDAAVAPGNGSDPDAHVAAQDTAPPGSEPH